MSVFLKHCCYLELEHWQVQRLIFGLQSLQPGSITMGFPEFLAIAYLSVNFNLVYSLFFILKSCQNFSVGYNLFLTVSFAFQLMRLFFPNFFKIDPHDIQVKMYIASEVLAKV